MQLDNFQKVKFKHWGKAGSLSLKWDFNTGRYYTEFPDYSNWIPKESPDAMSYNSDEPASFDIDQECPF